MHLVKRGVIIVRRKTRLLVATMVAACLMLPIAAFGTSANGDRQWTVLMYFGADKDDLYQATEFGMNQALKGFQDAKKFGGADLTKTSVVVLIDGPSNGDTEVYELTETGLNPRTSDAFGTGNVEKDMTSPETLRTFINWGRGAFPAEHTMLILKNGHAWCGICPDMTDNQGDEKLLMPIEDVRWALEQVNGGTGKIPLVDAVVFDGDNMGSIEVAYELRKVTNYTVGSQQQVPLEGLPYYLFVYDLAVAGAMDSETACITMVNDYVKYYNNTKGTKPTYDKLLANSQMAVTGAVFRMGPSGALMEGVVDSFEAFLRYMISGELPDTIRVKAEGVLGEDTVQDILNQWKYPDATGDWSFIPINRNNIASSRDKALIGKMNDQQGYEWLPDVYTWLWSISALVNYEDYGDPDPPSGDVPPETIPEWYELTDPFVRLLLEDFMNKFGYVEPGIYRGVWHPDYLTEEPGALVWIAQSQILDRSGNSFPHGLNIWFPPTWLQWDDEDAWSLLFNKPMTYSYWGIGVWLGTGEVIYLPAEYYCIDCPVSYENIGLDFVASSCTSWIEFLGMYYDSRMLVYT